MKIFLSSKADKELCRLPRLMYRLIFERIEHLATNPFPPQSKKLAGRPGWRLRIGDYRVLYMVDSRKKEITVLSVAHRKDVYRF